MEILADYLIFLLKVFTIAVAITVPLLLIIGSSKGKSQSRGKLSITNLSDKYEDMGNAIKSSLMNPKELKKFNKNLSKEKKKRMIKKIQYLCLILKEIFKLLRWKNLNKR